MSSRTAALAFTHRSVWCRPPTGSPRSGDYRCGSVSSALTSGPCARWPWRRLKHTRRVEAAAKKPFLWAAPWTRELISPFSIFTATVSKLLPLPMAQIDASITFPKAPWPKTFPVPGGETEERRIYFCPIRLEASSHVGIQRICMEEEDSEIQPRLLRSKHVLFLFSKAVLGIRKREKNSVDVAQPSAIKNSGCGDLMHFQPSILLRVPCFLPPSATLSPCHPPSRPAASVCALTKSEPVPGDLPLRGVVGQVFTLLIQRHLARVHDDGQIACLDVRRVDLKFRVERRSERRQPVRGRMRKEERKKGNLKKDWKSGVSFAKLPPVRVIFHP